MNRIARIVAESCGEGVAFRRLADVARIKNGKSHALLNPGAIPVYGSGGVMTRVDKAAYDKPTVLIPRKGSLGNLFYVDEPFWNVDTIFYTEVNASLVLPKFLYYVLSTMRLAEMNQAGGVPSQTQAVLNELMLPVPPLDVQGAIVELLDDMEALSAQLKREVEARRKQFEYYRGTLLSFDRKLSDGSAT